MISMVPEHWIQSAEIAGRHLNPPVDLASGV